LANAFPQRSARTTILCVAGIIREEEDSFGKTLDAA